MSQLSKLFLFWITSASFLFVSNSVVSESLPNPGKANVNDQSQSLSAPSSDTPQEEASRETKLENENLSSPPIKDPSTNNAPFDEKLEKSTHGKHKQH